MRQIDAYHDAQHKDLSQASHVIHLVQVFHSKRNGPRGRVAAAKLMDEAKPLQTIIDTGVCEENTIPDKKTG